jgi:hypothetical protein
MCFQQIDELIDCGPYTRRIREPPSSMSIRISRHAKRQMKWRKITEAEMESTIADPDMQQDSIKGRKNAYKKLGGRLVKVTYCREEEDFVIVTAVIKGE